MLKKIMVHNIATRSPTSSIPCLLILTHMIDDDNQDNHNRILIEFLNNSKTSPLVTLM